MNKFTWLVLMAARDSRKNRSRLFLFVSSIILGIAALVAINSFGENLKDDINSQAKELLGADLELGSNNEEAHYAWLDSVDHEVSQEYSFASMTLFLKNDESRLMDIRALEGNFPYYGTLETEPASAATTFRDGTRKVLIDKATMIQYDVSVGDSVRIGNLNFIIEGQLLSSPSQSVAATLVAPAVYMPMSFLSETDLIRKGSRVFYRKFYKFKDLDPDFDLDQKLKDDREVLRLAGIRADTVEERKEETGETFRDLTNFLNLVAFVALLLGCVGVASAVHIYIKGKIKSVAILRCLGAKGSDTFMIYLIQIIVIGFIGSVLGALLGTIIQRVLPEVFANFLPVKVSLAISWKSILAGIIIGLFVSVLFALIPLLNVRRASPLLTLRNIPDQSRQKFDPLKLLVYLGIVLFIVLFAYLQTQRLGDSIAFTFFIIIAFAFLALVARFAMWLVKKFFPSGWSYTWRQSLANLYRPNNQTQILISSIGLGTALITTLYFIQTLLIGQVEITTDNDRPNMLLFDVQSYQIKEVSEFTRKSDLPVIQEVPIVAMRIQTINEVTQKQAMQDSTIEYRNFLFNREFRVTYRDTLIESESIADGELRPYNSPQDSIFISMDEGFAKSQHFELGDEVIWNVQGVPIKTYIGSMREIDWNRVQTNFLVLFPSGVLEYAPQFHVLVTRIGSTEQGALYQREIVKKYPNISVLDIGLILNTLDDILDKVAFVIRFMALFSIITGLLVLVGSVILSKFQRIRESILLRTLGAHKRQITSINLLEYFFLGSLASMSGILLSLAGSWALAYFSFETEFTPNLLPVLWVYLIITGLTILIGLSNSRGITSRPPLEVLRSEI